jgi:hypothetical protein
MKFIVHHLGNQKGPWTREEITQRLNQKELEWTDYIFDDDRRDWVMLMEHATFAEQFQKWKQPISSATSAPPENGAEWYILRDENKYGPFLFVELLKMLQEKKLFEFDFVWKKSSMESWARISEVPDFQPEKVRKVKEEGGIELKDVFFRRRHARAQYGASILLHNNKEVWSGKSMEVSSGGAGLLIESGDIQVGQSLFLHFKAGDGVPPFNAVCNITSKAAAKKGYRYGIKFTSISQSVQQAIKKFAEKSYDKKIEKKVG